LKSSTARDILILLGTVSSLPVGAGEELACPSDARLVLESSTHLITVQTNSWDSSRAKLRFWQRELSRPSWGRASVKDSLDAVIGTKGLAWGYLYARLAGPREPIKIEGDRRSPAGVYKLGKRFGFADVPSKDYERIYNSTYCIDDPQSRYYNQIVNTSTIRPDWRSAEAMREIDLYRSGIEIKYVSNASLRAGSCIFMHIWRSADSGTAGCVAVPEDTMSRIKLWLREGRTAVALLPSERFKAWAGCFPGVNMGLQQK
jgi:L,D-peptidoglycan transpeptidase YkuD (ErfK/YbiS/YcfS/YnhG family)